MQRHSLNKSVQWVLFSNYKKRRNLFKFRPEYQLFVDQIVVLIHQACRRKY